MAEAPAVHDTLTESDAARILEELLDAQNSAHLLGLMLNVKPRDVEAIQNKYQDQKDRLYHIILAFLSQAEPRPTWRVIVDALRSRTVNLTALARRVEAAHFPDLTAARDVVPETTDTEPAVNDTAAAAMTTTEHHSALARRVEAAHFPDLTAARDVVPETTDNEPAVNDTAAAAMITTEQHSALARRVEAAHFPDPTATRPPPPATGPSSPDCIQPQKGIKGKCEEREGLCPTCGRRAVPFSLSAPKTFQFFVKTKEKYIALRAASSATVKEIKMKIESETGIPVDQQHLMHSERQLKDDNWLGYYNIGPDSTVFLDQRLRGRGPGGSVIQFVNDRSLLDEKFDYDFTNVWDDGRDYYRGGKRYYPPYGWKRLGMIVLGMYGDDVWLGEAGIRRTEETPGEWPVAYHALKNPEAADSIARGGFNSGRSERAVFGKGIYSAPSIEMVAEHFARPFTVDGVTYKLVLQNRVSTEGLEIVPANTPGAFGEYWVQPNDQLIRPYGLCIKVVSRTTASAVKSAVSAVSASVTKGLSKLWSGVFN